MKKRFVAILISILAMFCLLFGFAACGKNESQTAKIASKALTVEGDCVTGLTEYGKTLTKLVIPSEIDGVKITAIGGSAFAGCSNLTSVTIESGVTSIYPFAFYSCRSLTSVTIPNSVTSIEHCAFDFCFRLVEVINKSKLNITKGSSDFGGIGNYALTVHNGASKIVNKGGYSFIADGGTNYLLGYTGSETKLVLPNKYNGESYQIYKYAFYGCNNLTSVTIPNGVTSIGDCAFDCCVRLVEVINKSELNITKGSSDFGFVGRSAFTVHNGESKIVNKDGYSFIADDGTNYLVSYTGTETELALPNDYNGENYQINACAFGACNSLTSVKIPDSVTSIGGSAFLECNSLTSITIGNGVTSIGNFAFSGCRSLTSVTIPNSVTSIGDYAFGVCSSLTSITIPNNVTSIGDSAFWGCSSLTSVTIPNSVTSIGNYAFRECSSLAEINVNSANTAYQSIDGNLYMKDGKTLIQYAIGKTATSFAIPDSVTSIGERAFENCSSLESITIPDSVTSIGDSAFGYCRSLTSVTIGSGVTSIGEDAFLRCSITSVYITDIAAWFNISGLSNLLEYWTSEKELYLNDVLLTELVIPDGMTSIADYAFSGYRSLTSVTIPNSVTSIGEDSFKNCSSLTSITIPDSVTSIGDSAFSYCSSLTSVTIGNGVTSIGDYAFYNCSKLTRVYYKGTASEWNNISIGGYNSSLKNATVYYYSETKPASSGNYWHYVDGKPTAW